MYLSQSNKAQTKANRTVYFYIGKADQETRAVMGNTQEKAVLGNKLSGNPPMHCGDEPRGITSRGTSSSVFGYHKER